jgi:hypothetical protein
MQQAVVQVVLVEQQVQRLVLQMEHRVLLG